MQIDNGFTFNGKHSLNDMGLICVKGKSRTVAVSGEVYSYEVGGLNGTLAYGDRRKTSPYTVTVSLYNEGDLDSETEASRKWRTVRSWLLGGRHDLIWDSEPDVQWEAEVTKIDGATDNSWPDEYLKVTFKVQPEGRSVHMDVRMLQVTGDDPVTAVLDLRTEAEAPLCVLVGNMGSAQLDGMTVTAEGRTIQLSGMELQAMECAQVECEVPMRANLVTFDGSPIGNLMPCVDRLDRVMVKDGSQVTVTIAFAGQGRKMAMVQLAVRGVWT